MMMNTVAIDFDGVIHSYSSGWHGAESAPDPPVPGIIEAIRDMRKAGYDVVVVSSRCSYPGGEKAIERYLDKHGIQVDGITGEKIPALVYIDDRAIRFDGKPETLLKQVEGFKPWNR